MKMRAEVTISRASDDTVRIRITDEASRVEFAVLSLTVEQYGYAITGLSGQMAELEVRGLEHVGKRRITQPRRTTCPLDTYDRGELEKWLLDNCQEAGWTISTYLGAQNSIVRRSGVTELNYTVTKYVDEAGT